MTLAILLGLSLTLLLPTLERAWLDEASDQQRDRNRIAQPLYEADAFERRMRSRMVRSIRPRQVFSTGARQRRAPAYRVAARIRVIGFAALSLLATVLYPLTVGVPVVIALALHLGGMRDRATMR